MIEFKYNKKGELEGWKNGQCIGKMDQTPSWMFPNAFKKEETKTEEQGESNSMEENKIRKLLARYGASEQEINNFMTDLANEKDDADTPNEEVEEEEFGWYDEETIGKLNATQEGKELIAGAPDMAKEELEQAIKKYLGK